MIRRFDLLACLAIATASLTGQEPTPQISNAVTPDRLTEILSGEDPKNPAELEAMQKHVQSLIQRVLPATVSLPGASGVLVRRADATYVLSAAHVTMMADQRFTITKHNGKRLRGTSLGANHISDVGLVRVDTEEEQPAAEFGKSEDLKRGQWVLMLGHPSGAKQGRSAPARLGRVLRVPSSGYLVTDCTMQAGDSGGPLFDMDGRVVGINSRINRNLAMNMHAPIDALVNDWDKLQDGKVTQSQRRGRRPRLGFGISLVYGDGCPVFEEVPEDSAAFKAGLKQGDRLFEVDGTEVDNRRSVLRILREFRAGDEVTIVIERNGKGIELQLAIVEEDQ
jgi:serine protease Do